MAKKTIEEKKASLAEALKRDDLGAREVKRKQARLDKLTAKEPTTPEISIPENTAPRERRTRPEPSPIAPPTPMSPEEQARIVQDLLDKANAYGQGVANQYYAPGSLPTVDTNIDPLMQEVIDRQKAGLEGYTAPENQAMLEKAMSGINSDFLTNLRGIQSANVMNNRIGGAAFDPLARLSMNKTNAAANVNRDIFLENVNEKQRRLSGYGDLLEKTLGEQQRRKEFNIGQAEKEKAGAIGAQLGGAGLYAGVSGGVSAEDQARLAAEAQQRAEQQYRDFVAQQNRQNQRSQEKIYKGLGI